MNKWYKSVSNWIFLIALIILIPVLAINLWIMYQANTDKDNVDKNYDNDNFNSFVSTTFCFFLFNEAFFCSSYFNLL